MGKPTWLVTGGCGFIGGNFVRRQLSLGRAKIVNLDALTYAGNLDTLHGLLDHPDHCFVHGSICDRELVRELLAEHRPEAIVHFAAESHVDRSIDAPGTFVQTNVVGTFELLEAARHYWKGLSGEERERFRFLHVSTDEVYGSLGFVGRFTEETPYRPSSPYSASKAASDHFVRAYFKTYGLPTIVTNCSNNYGPYQFPEKLIPLMILNALEGRPLPVYGEGKNIRDWLYVEDHCRALEVVLEKGRPGETYNIGGNAERTNLEVVRQICQLMDRFHPEGAPHERLITFVEDRPGHDFRYAMDTSKIRWELGWQPEESFESGLEKTVRWYLENGWWWRRVCDGTYRRERLGLGR